MSYGALYYDIYCNVQKMLSLFLPPHPCILSLSLSNTVSDVFAIICLIKPGEHVAEPTTKNKSHPSCTSACSLLITLNKWHSYSPHMAQRVCNANTQKTLALLVPSTSNSPYVFESVSMWGNALQMDLTIFEEYFKLCDEQDSV